MATLSLPGLTVGLPIWLFPTSLVPVVSTSGQLVPPPEQNHVDSKVDLSPSSPASTSSSSTSPGESLDSSNQVAKKRKKKTKKKKSPKGEAKSAATPPSPPQVGPPFAPPRKVKFPCRLCKDDHLLYDCPGIPRVLEVWSRYPARPSSSSEVHGDATYQLEMVREKGRFESPVDFVKAIIPFTFVRSWIKPLLSWKVLQLPHPNFPLVINVSLQPQIVPLLTKRSTKIPLLSSFLFPNLALPSLFQTNHWSERVSTRVHHPLTTIFWKSIIPMFFSSPQILLSPEMTLLSQLLPRVLLWFL